MSLVTPVLAAKHDYRERWMTFTRRLSTPLDDHDIARELAAEIGRNVAATPVAVYLRRHGEAAYRLSAARGTERFAPTIEPGDLLGTWLAGNAAPALFPEALREAVTSARRAHVFVIRWRSEVLGFVLVGAAETADDDADDLAFVVTLVEQAAAPVMAARLAAAGGSADEELGRRSTGVLHDIKNAVAALSLLARNAASHLTDPEFQGDAIATLSRTVERIQRLLGKLAAADTEAAPTRREPIDLRQLIIEATSPLAIDRRVRLVRRLRPVAPVYGDRDALLRVVENLTTNAAEAVDRDGTVTVTLAQERGHAVISVSDTGRGIPAEYREHYLFSPFRSTKKGGWGIGLYQTKQAVERQDGEIVVESTEGRGATFTVRLPLGASGEQGSLEKIRWATSRSC
jgi:putative PEP-CTERM system histidine kinase